MFVCKHRYEGREKIAEASPARTGFKASWVTETFMARIAHGSTTYRQTCVLCGKDHTYEVLGHE